MARGDRYSDKSKEELVIEVFDKINCQIDGENFNPNNGTISKNGLLAISNGINNIQNQDSTKQNIVIQICNQLSLNNDINYFNPKDGTITAKFLVDVNNKLQF